MYLSDVNFWLAFAFQSHEFHSAAKQWAQNTRQVARRRDVVDSIGYESIVQSLLPWKWRVSGELLKGCGKNHFFHADGVTEFIGLNQRNEPC